MGRFKGGGEGKSGVRGRVTSGCRRGGGHGVGMDLAGEDDRGAKSKFGIEIIP